MNTINFVKSYLLERGFIENKSQGLPNLKSFFVGKNFIEISYKYFTDVIIEEFSSANNKAFNHYMILDGVHISTRFGSSMEKLAEDLSKIIH